MRRALRLCLTLTCGAAGTAAGQLAPPGTGGVGALLHDLTALGANKRVLVIGAHPDDEDTDLLTLLARGMGVQTAYLSLSRGEGGQNLIGPELGPELGVIRTEELLAARRLDGARQYFTRAYDFGFSKSAAETFRFWPRDSLLADVIAAIRRFRPQIIISIFGGTPADGHGHHQVAGLLARQVFDLLADSSWGPAKLYRSARFDSAAATMTLDAGTLDPATGRSYHQIAMAGRGQHRSQEQGRLENPGPSPVRLALVKSREGGSGQGEGGLFAGVDTLLPARQRYAALIDSARGAFNPLRSETILPLLVRALHEIAADTGLVAADQRAILARALATAGAVAVDAITDRWIVTGEDSLQVDVNVWNAGDSTVRIDSVHLVVPAGWTAQAPAAIPDRVAPGTLTTARFTVISPPRVEPSQPYFLRLPLRGALYDWSAAPPESRGLPFEPPLIEAQVHVRLDGGAVTLSREVAERRRDEAVGEVRRPIITDCDFDVTLGPELVFWPLEGRGSGARALSATVTNRTRRGTSARFDVAAPPGWSSLRDTTLRLERDGTVSLRIPVTPLHAGSPPSNTEVSAVAVDSAGQRCGQAVSLISYPHIRPRPVVHPAVARLRLAHLVLPAVARVGYVRGAADRVPEALKTAGLPVELLDADTLRHGSLSRYDAIVIGSRAYETDAALVAANPRILAYARAGGLVIVQYQQLGFFQRGLAPYPLNVTRPADRVTDETAPVMPVDSSARVLRFPNPIGADDWRGWVQERGLYFAHDWAPAYQSVLEMHDPGDPPQRGGLLVARVGKGTYVYTGLAFFRQLPAGVPGAYRLFANLLALNK